MGLHCTLVYAIDTNQCKIYQFQIKIAESKTNGPIFYSISIKKMMSLKDEKKNSNKDIWDTPIIIPFHFKLPSFFWELGGDILLLCFIRE